MPTGKFAKIPSPYTIPIWNRLLRPALRLVFCFLLRLINPVYITGREHIPLSGVIIAINHISLCEAPFALAFWPVAPEATGAAEIRSKPRQNLLVRLYHGAPVHYRQYDCRLLEKAIRMLQPGQPLLIASEGRRSHKPGIRRIADLLPEDYPGIYASLTE